MHRATSWEATQALFEACPDPMWIFDAEDLRFLAVNDAAAVTYGYSRDEFLSMTIADIRPKEDVESLVQATRWVVSGVLNAGRWRHLTKAGEILIVEVRTQRLTWDGRDAKMALIRNLSREVALDLEITRLLQNEREARLRAERCEAHLQAILGAMPGGHVVLEAADLTILAQARGSCEDEPALERMRQMLSTGDPALVAELRRIADQRRSEIIDLGGPGGGGEPVMCSCVCDSNWITKYLVLRPVAAEGPEGFATADEGDSAFRWALQAQTIQARDTALRECSARLRAVQKQMDVGFWTYDLEAGVLWWSDEVHSIFGIAPGRGPVTQAQYHDLILPEDQETAARAFGDFMAGRTELLQFEHRVVRPDGEIAHIRGTGSLEEEDGRRRIIGVVQDISAMRRTEDERNRVEHLMQIAGRAAHFGGWRVDVTTGIIEWSPETAAILDAPSTRFIDLEMGYDLYPDEVMRQRAAEMFRRCVEEGQPFDETLQMLTQAKRLIWSRVVGVPVHDGQGRVVAAHGSLQDVTEQEETRRQREWLAGRLTQTLEQMGDAFYTLDREWRFTFMNRAAKEYFAGDADACLGQVIWEVFPATLDTNLRQQFERAIATQEPALFDFHSTARQKWLHMRAHPIDDGLLVYFREVTRERGHTRTFGCSRRLWRNRPMPF